MVPYVDFERKEDFIELAKELNEIGLILKEHGLQLCYHNHAHELEEYDGVCGLDLLYEVSKAELVKAELDTYWVKKAGLDPVEYVRKFNGRVPLLHLKDMEANTEDFAEIGEGIIDIEGLIKQAEIIGTEWLIVEQDKCKRPALESIEISYNNLISILND